MQRDLDTFIARAREIIHDLMEQGRFDIDCIVPAITGRMAQQAQVNLPAKQLLIPYCRQRAEVRKHGKSSDSQKRYDRFLVWLETWGGMVTMDDVTEANIIMMDEALSAKLGSHEMLVKSKWHNYHRFLNTFINDAIDDGLLTRNPYKRLNIGRGDDDGSLDKYITKDEFARIQEADMPTKHLERARDLFVFQVCTCMAYVDMAAFDVGDVVEQDGVRMYTARRGKTRQEFRVMLLPPALAVLDKYGQQLPLMTNQKYNDALKVIASICGIHKPLSSHWARHTGATLLLNAGVDMEVVAKVLGHATTRITRSVYAKLLDKTIATEMSKMM